MSRIGREVAVVFTRSFVEDTKDLTSFDAIVVL